MPQFVEIDFEFVSEIQEELKKGLMLFWTKAENILSNSGVELVMPKWEAFQIEDHFFSLLFLYAYVKADIDSQKRAIYVAANQCLRGMVTGCDNLLDEEYKVTLQTGLPKEGITFRSVLDIMVSDRILTEVMFHGFHLKLFTLDQVRSSGKLSLDALIKSGAQEAGEEKGIQKILSSQSILNDIHSIKTGMLFQAPWALPDRFEENLDHQKCEKIKKALFEIGMGCQILDDMVDLIPDLKMKHHNYVVSTFYEARKKACETLIDDVCKNGEALDEKELVQSLQQDFPELFKTTAHKAQAFLESGCKALFSDEHEYLIPFCISFLIRRIGAQSFFEKDKFVERQ